MIEFTKVSLTPIRIVKPADLSDLVSILSDLGLHNAAQEQLWVLALDSINQVRTVTPVAVGTYHDCFVAIPTVLSPVLLSATDRFIIAHNHPNGKVKPTPEDIDLTARIEAAADLLDMSFDDHLILSPGGIWASMSALGHIKGKEQP